VLKSSMCIGFVVVGDCIVFYEQDPRYVLPVQEE